MRTGCIRAWPRLVAAMAAAAPRERRGFLMDINWLPLPSLGCISEFCPELKLNNICDLVFAVSQAINFVSKSLQDKSIHMYIKIKHSKYLLEFRISGFESCCNTAKQISTVLETDISILDYCIQEKKILSYE